MRTPIRYILAVVAAVSLLASCQKEVDFQFDNNNPGNGGGPGTGSSKPITGDYDFVGLSATTTVTINVSAGGQQLKTITSSGYKSFNNTGTANITSSKMNFTGLGYEVDTMMNVKTYLDGALFDDSDVPFVATYPPSNGIYDYTRNNADSLTILNASFLPVGGSPGQSQTSQAPLGSRITWSGDTLLLNIKQNINMTFSQGGIPATMVAKLDGVMKLKKK